jgi:hypothetical protein
LTHASCSDWAYYCKTFWEIFPALEPNPFYPVPPFINANNDFGGITIPYDPTPRNNTFSFVLLLTKTDASGSHTVFFEQDLISSSRIQFMNLVTNSEGEPVEGDFKFVQVKTKCYYPQFDAIRNEIDPLITKIQASEDTQVIRQTRFLIDTAKFSNAWLSCQELLNGMLTANSTTTELPTTGCWTSVYDVAQWDNDPCCWELPAWKSDCKPQLRNVSVTTVTANKAAIQST